MVSRNRDVNLRGRIFQGTLYRTKEDLSLCTLRGKPCEEGLGEPLAEPIPTEGKAGAKREKPHD